MKLVKRKCGNEKDEMFQNLSTSIRSRLTYLIVRTRLSMASSKSMDVVDVSFMDYWFGVDI